MAIMKKYALEKEYVQVPNQTAKAVEGNENNISLQALGLIVNLWSYDVTSWELHKTELYKRYGANRKTSVSSAWSELVEHNYIIEFKYRNGRSWEYIYYYRIEPFSDKEIELILIESVEEYGLSSTSDFQQLNFNSSKRTVQNPQINNTKLKKDTITKKEIKEKNKKDIKKDDDDKNASSEPNILKFKEFVQEFENQMPNTFDNAMYDAIFEEMKIQHIDIITFTEAVNQARYMQKRIDQGELLLGDYAKYFIGGIKLKRTSAQSALNAERFAREVRNAEVRKSKKSTEIKSVTLPFYNWLDGESEK